MGKRNLFRLCIIILIFLVIVDCGVFAYSISYSSTTNTEGAYSSSLSGQSTSLGSSLDIQSSTVSIASPATPSPVATPGIPKISTLGTANPYQFTVSDNSITRRQGTLDRGGIVQYSVTVTLPSKVLLKVSDGGSVQIYTKKGGEAPSEQTFQQDYLKRVRVTPDKSGKFTADPGIWYYTVYSDTKMSKYLLAVKGG